MNEEENMQQDSKPGHFGLPEGYFQKLTGSVMDKIAWLEEHKDFPVLASLQSRPGFAVPKDYFLRSEQTLEIVNYPKLAALKKQPVFTVPAAYFEELEARELGKAMNDREPLLESIPKAHSFKVNDTYFAEKEQALQELLLKQNAPARVVPLFTARLWTAVAALLVMVLGLWIYTSQTAPAAEAKDCGTMACLDKQDLLKSKSLESLETDELYDLVNSKTLEEKLEDKNAAPQHKKADSLSGEDADAMDNLLDEI